jgi:hypothetical protein
VNTALEAAVVVLVVATTFLGTSLALRALPAEMPAHLRRIARICGVACGAGLGSVLVLGLLVHDAGLDGRRTVTLDALLLATLIAIVAEHAAASRLLRMRWVCTPGSELPVPVMLQVRPRTLVRLVLRRSTDRWA